MEEPVAEDSADKPESGQRPAAQVTETAFERRRRKKREASEKVKGSRFSYTARLMGAFVLTAVMTAAIAASILAVVWENQFQSYTRENMENLATKTANQISKEYRDGGGFTADVYNTVSEVTTLSPDIAVQILDASGNVVYTDAQDENTTAGADSTVVSLSPSPTQIASAPITVDGANVGTVRVWAFQSNALLTQNDIQFRSDSYKALLIATIIAVFLAAIVGLLIAKGMLIPVKRITNTAKKVRDGDLKARTEMVGGDEVSQLGETFDEMADSIERDRELERKLTTDVAHELRTPLMGIQATTEAIIDGVFEPDDERLNAINSETMRLKRLVEALLNLSRLESGAEPFNEERIDLVELMHSLVMSHEALLEAAELTLVFEADDSVIVDGDPDMLRQATANLISNAVRYNKPGGTVTLSVHARGDMAAIAVSDTGIGIAEEDQERVFSRFWRADAGRNRASGGLGVGLAVVKELVDYHNGRIEVESEVGVGTTFTILIPRYIVPVEESRRGFPTIVGRTKDPDKAKADREKAEKAKADKAEKSRLEKEKSEKAKAEKAEKARAGRAAKAARDKAAREKAAKAKAERNQEKDQSKDRTRNTWTNLSKVWDRNASSDDEWNAASDEGASKPSEDDDVPDSNRDH